MDHWLLSLSVMWLTLVVFAATALVTGLIYGTMRMLGANGRTGAFKAVSPRMLPPLGLVFGLLVGFLAAQVWGDSDRARLAVNRQASPLRTVALLAASIPGGVGNADTRAALGAEAQERGARARRALMSTTR